MSSVGGPFCLYRLFDADGDLLYVGATKKLQARMAAHRRSQTWWEDVDEAATRVEWHASPQDAAAAEQAAIREERPAWNRSGRNSPAIRYSPRSHSVRDKPIPAESAKALKEWAEKVASSIQNRNAAIIHALENGATVPEIVELTGLSRGRIYQIKDEMAAR